MKETTVPVVGSCGLVIKPARGGRFTPGVGLGVGDGGNGVGWGSGDGAGEGEGVTSGPFNVPSHGPAQEQSEYFQSPLNECPSDDMTNEKAPASLGAV